MDKFTNKVIYFYMKSIKDTDIDVIKRIEII